MENITFEIVTVAMMIIGFVTLIWLVIERDKTKNEIEYQSDLLDAIDQEMWSDRSNNRSSEIELDYQHAVTQLNTCLEKNETYKLHIKNLQSNLRRVMGERDSLKEIMSSYKTLDKMLNKEVAKNPCEYTKCNKAKGNNKHWCSKKCQKLSRKK